MPYFDYYFNIVFTINHPVTTQHSFFLIFWRYVHFFLSKKRTAATDRQKKTEL